MKTFAVLGLLAATAAAKSVQDVYNARSIWHLPGRNWTSPPSMGNSTFDQLIDHEDPSLGTFEQFYFYSTEFWGGPGSPVVLFTPGEINVTGYSDYLSTNRTTGVIAQTIGAAVVVLEHRYWGTSTPFTELTTANMTYLTLQNSILDLTYFANEANLPFAHHGSSSAKHVPWVLAGGSYSGALSAWTESVAPGTFWAYLASSAPTEAVSNYWGYFLPVQEGMPKNCSSDVSLVIDYIDGLKANGSTSEIAKVKAMFGLEDLEHYDDFGAAIENGPWLWQGNQFYTTTGFYEWCDYVENAVNVTNATALPGAGGVGLQKALAGYASWFKTVLLPGYCEGYGYFSGTMNIECFETYNATNPMYTDVSLSNTVDRQWEWMLCNEPFGYWQDGAPANRSSIVSRYVDAAYWIRQCPLYFPTGPDGQTFGIAKGKTEAEENAYTGGWNILNSTRLIYANGGYDPWREAGVSSDLRPGGPAVSTTQVPINVIPGGFHTSDLVTENGVVNAGAKAVIDAEVAQIAAWVAEYPKRYHGWKA